jgi:RNA polymerase sigma factor (sigma-70 family)
MNKERGAYVNLDPTRELTDAQLLAALVAGGAAARDAWSTLVARYSHKLYAIGRSFGFDESTAEDLVQTAWLRLLERPGQLREPSALAAWLGTVVRNEARNRITRRREIPTLQPLEVRADETDDLARVETRMVRQARARALRLAFAYLGTECQQLLRLLLVEPALSYDEIAAALGRPRGALGPTRRRCLDQLRSRLPNGFEE